MKKKSLFFMFSFIFIVSSLFASVGYKLDLVSLDPLHEDYFADSTSSNFSLNYLYFDDGFPNRILQDVRKSFDGEENKVKVWEFHGNIKPVNRMVHLKLGETMSLFRNTFTFDSFLSPIAFDFAAQGMIQQFYRGSFDDMVGFDGLYFFGGNLRVADVASMRIGYHHYCTHYGDAVLKRIEHIGDTSPKDTSIFPPYEDFWIEYKYVRMNDFVISLSLEPSSWLRLYGELKFPPKNILSFRPDMFAPNWVERDGFKINPGYPDSYNARIVTLGFELEYPIFKKLGNTTFGYNLTMYEEGKVIYDHFEGGAIHFDENAPWEKVHDIRIAQDLSDTLSLEVSYHNGRSLFNALYFQHTSIVSIGLRFNPYETLTLFNTNKDS